MMIESFVRGFPDVPEFYEFYTPMQYLMFCGEISKMRKKECKEKAEELIRLDVYKRQL